MRTRWHSWGAFPVESHREDSPGVLFWPLFHYDFSNPWVGAVEYHQDFAGLPCALAASGVLGFCFCGDYAAVPWHYPAHEAVFTSRDRTERRILMFNVKFEV